MSGDEYLSTEILRHGAYLCIRVRSGTDTAALARVSIPALADRLGLENEFDPPGAPPQQAVGFLRRQAAAAGEIPDEGVEGADCVVHVASRSSEPVARFCVEARELVEPYAELRVLAGVVRPRNYTGAAMEKFAYAGAVAPKPGTVMPNGFLIPMSKTGEWWRKDWMERHTYFLPRYDDEGRMTAEGHALAAAAGIPCILRRTYHALEQPAPAGSYDFVTYFECADPDVRVFETIRANLRDVKRNPEWKFVREGPTWRGRRVPAWEDMFVAPPSGRDARRGGS